MTADALTVEGVRSLQHADTDDRVAAFERFAAAPTPTPEQEIWRYSRISELDLAAYRPGALVTTITGADAVLVDDASTTALVGIDVDHVNDLGWTALLEAVVLGDGGETHQRVVQVLLEAGADRSIRDRDGRTALDHARASGYAEIAALLDG